MLRNKLNLILAALVILAACEQMPTNNPSAETEVSEDVPSGVHPLSRRVHGLSLKPLLRAAFRS